MIIRKSELAKKIDKVKNIVVKKANNEALSGVLVQDGYLIAANTEMRIKGKLEGIGGQSECFIIPERAFDLIKNLPEGDVEITVDKNHAITIKMEKIKNTYNSFPSEEYMPVGGYSVKQDDASEAVIDSNKLKGMISHVLYAIPKQSSDRKMTSMCLEAADGHLNAVGLDGHVLAWDWEEFEGDFKFMLPRAAVEKLMSLDISGEVNIAYDKFGALFSFDGYEVYTRLVEGQYFQYQQLFNTAKNNTKVRRADILNAITRAKLCTDEKVPVKMEITDAVINLSIADKKTNYAEDVSLLAEMPEPLVIGFDSRLVQESLKAMDYKELDLGFSSPKLPMIISSEESNARALVLPVNMQGTS